MDLAEFYEKVYDTVRLVPQGKVTSYGHIAALVGMPRHSRHVGAALKILHEDSDVPWQRIVSSTGVISSRGPGTTGAQRQAEALEAEGVHVETTRMGQFKVSFATNGWFPRTLQEAQQDAQ
ncbi:related to methylated-dna--protein-cysteine methyltransferase [Serendipita indica DSM 11827]|uniref:Related to methylated-dna--protein-cysteine methyltransferase n=1 Tax=Serendipita indica (strain DSM 11827) TaxID=1109443 RepID=G4U2C8_SERID|nr:related to methylated-dna--protein-cysteine methyltransferase [Serendipita indica DSM 11827]